MTSPSDPARRTLLTAIAALAAVAMLPGAWVERLVGVAPLNPLNPLDALLRRLATAPEATAIAEQWLASAPSISPAALRDALVRDVGPSGQRLSVAIADDFANGRMRLHDGWPVAETEARLCALAHLARG